ALSHASRWAGWANPTKSPRWRSTSPPTNPPLPPAPSTSWMVAGPTEKAGARMKLVRYGSAGKERPGLSDATGPLGDVFADIDAHTLGHEGRARLAKLDPQQLPQVTGEPRYGSPIAHVGKMSCVGMN